MRRFGPRDVASLEEAGRRIRETYGDAALMSGVLCDHAEVLDEHLDTYWQPGAPTGDLTVTFPAARTINRVVLQEAVGKVGQRVKEHALDARVGGEWRSSWITDPPDGKLPLTAEGKRLRDTAYSLTDPEARDSWERCLVGTGRAPMWSVPVENIRQIVQTPTNLLIYTEEGADTRIIGIGASHRPAAIKSRLGDSVARWEGDTLVVETLNQIDNYAPFPTMPQSVRLQSKIIERFSLLSPDEILYRFTIEDPAVYSAPWSAEYSLNREHTTAYENGCHEGNYSLPNILRTERLKETRQARPP